MTNEPYSAPLDQLLTLGDAQETTAWADYLALGLGPEHVPDLIRMATDPELHDGDSDSPTVWAPGHAWRALAQLRASEAAEPLAELFRRVDENDDDFVGEDLPEAFGVLGAGAIPALMAYLTDGAHGLWARVAAAHALEQIGMRHPQAREAVVAVLAGQLGLFAQQDLSLNGSLIAFLVDLKAVEAADVIQQAFAAGRVDEMVDGDWEDVQVKLGLKDQREGRRRPPQPGTAAAALYQLSQGLREAQPKPLAAPDLDKSRLARALRGTGLVAPSGPKRKHHRKRK